MTETATTAAAPTVGMYIDGQDIMRRTRAKICDPSNRTNAVGAVAVGSAADVEHAATSAHRAGPGWAGLEPAARAAAIQAGLQRVAARAEELAALYTRENGKPLFISRIEFMMAAGRGAQTLALAGELLESSSRGEKFLSRVRRRPFGVVASIIPWNSPIALGFGQVIGALLCGNTVVAKPPGSCPLALSTALRELGAALPPGVLNVVVGDRRQVGTPLIAHRLVEKIVFTGSTEAGREIIRASAETVKDLTLELGGNDAAIVLDDFDVDNAALVSGLVAGAFQNTGQVCMGVKRILVPTALAGRFTDAFVAATEKLRVGNGLAEGVSVGPAHQRETMDRVIDYSTNARDHGGRIVTAGVRDPSIDLERGNFIMPHIVTGVDDDSRVAREEQFAPIVPILTYDDVGEAVSRANATEFGLGGSVWGSDIERASDVAWQIEAGTVWVNGHGPACLNGDAPYGGLKQSGKGRKGGLTGLAEYYVTQTLTVPVAA